MWREREGGRLPVPCCLCETNVPLVQFINYVLFLICPMFSLPHVLQTSAMDSTDSYSTPFAAVYPFFPTHSKPIPSSCCILDCVIVAFLFLLSLRCCDKNEDTKVRRWDAHSASQTNSNRCLRCQPNSGGSSRQFSS